MSRNNSATTGAITCRLRNDRCMVVSRLFGRSCQGSVSRYGPTVFANPPPLATSLLIDQVIATRIAGCVRGGVKESLTLPVTRQSSASVMAAGWTNQRPAADGPASGDRDTGA